MRSRSNGGVIGAYALPTQNHANGVFFIHDAAIYNTGSNPIWPLASGLIYSATGGMIVDAVDNINYKTHIFTANGTFTVSAGAAYIDVFLVGGGGSVSYQYLISGTTQYYALGGGAGGEVSLVQNLYVTDGTTFTVEVGQGGDIGSYGSSSIPGVPGKPSKILSNSGYSVIAKGGGAGGSNVQVPTAGGSGGGGYAKWHSSTGYGWDNGSAAGARGDYIVGAGATVTSYRNAGGRGDTSGVNSTGSVNAGGGGGAGGAGYDGSYSFNPGLIGFGGDGLYYSRTGLYYGAGGAGGSVTRSARSGLYATNSRTSEGESGYDGYGVGASGQYWTNSTGSTTVARGGSGAVIFCYRYR